MGQRIDARMLAVSVTAMKPSELLVLNCADFSQLRETHPDAAVALLLALGQIQSRAMRWSAKEIQRLMQW